MNCMFWTVMTPIYENSQITPAHFSLISRISPNSQIAHFFKKKIAKTNRLMNLYHSSAFFKLFVPVFQLSILTGRLLQQKVAAIACRSSWCLVTYNTLITILPIHCGDNDIQPRLWSSGTTPLNTWNITPGTPNIQNVITAEMIKVFVTAFCFLRNFFFFILFNQDEGLFHHIIQNDNDTVKGSTNKFEWSIVHRLTIECTTIQFWSHALWNDVIHLWKSNIRMPGRKDANTDNQQLQIPIRVCSFPLKVPKWFRNGQEPINAHEKHQKYGTFKHLTNVTHC